MSLMLGDNAVTEIWKLLKENGYSGKVFKYEKPETFKENMYVVVNHLPFVHRGEVEEGVVNINVHVKKTSTNEPDTKKLTDNVREIVALLPKDTYLGGAYFNFYADSRPTPDNDGTFYINMQVTVIYNDLNY